MKDGKMTETEKDLATYKLLAVLELVLIVVLVLNY